MKRPPSTEPAVRVSSLRFRYPEGEFALDVPELVVAEGERVALIGPSGSGKTTLLQLISGIATPDAGEVHTCGVALTALGDGARRDFRIRHLGLVFQEFELLEYLSVLDNVLLPYRVRGGVGGARAALRLEPAVRERARKLAGQVGIEQKLGRRPQQLSHGERQRAAICRALVVSPSLVLADEPTGNLDPTTKGRVLDILFDYTTTSGASLVTVTHDHELLPRFDRVVDLSELLRWDP